MTITLPDLTLPELIWQWAIAMAYNIALIWLLDKLFAAIAERIQSFAEKRKVKK